MNFPRKFAKSLLSALLVFSSLGYAVPIPCHLELLVPTGQPSGEVKRELTIALFDVAPITGRQRATDGRFPIDISEVDRAAVVVEMGKRARQGFEMFDCRFEGNHFQLRFVKNEFLVTQNEETREPTFVASQRAALGASWPNPPRTHRENLENGRSAVSAFPSGTPLTSKSLDSFKPGTYSYIRHEGEPFLRLAKGVSYVGERALPPPTSARPDFGGMDFKHDSVAGHEGVSVAGEVDISYNATTKHNEVRYVNIQSGSYQFTISALPVAVEALWDQGIFQRELYLAMLGDKGGGTFYFILKPDSTEKLKAHFPDR